MKHEANFAVADHWRGGFDEAQLQTWAARLRSRLVKPGVSLGLLFMTPEFFPHAPQVLELLRLHGQIPLLVGCSGTSLIAGEKEIEREAGLVLGLYHLPGAELQALHFDQEQIEETNGAAYWHLETGISADETNGWLVFADPFRMNAEAWLRGWNEAYAPTPILGGLATGNPGEQLTQVYLNGEVFESGGVAVSFAGDVALASVISQGCTPIGETWTITKAEKHFILSIGNRPAYEVLVETFNGLPPEEQATARGNLFVGLVVNEYLEEFHRGDFLIRNLLGADPKNGAIAIGALPRAGQTIQFQRRAASAATEDLLALLRRTQAKLGDQKIFGGCLCSCNGRGSHLFGAPDHDASRVQQELGPLAVTGFFCNGEIGPVGERNFLHGYTASLALFVEKANSPK